MKHERWLQAATGGDSLRTVAAKIGVSGSTLSRQLSRNGRLSPEVVIEICRAYDLPVVDGLVDTGYLTAAEARSLGVARALRRATNQQLLDEVLRRSDPEATALFQGGNATPRPDRPENHAVSSNPPTPLPDESPYVLPDYLDMVADSDDEELGDDHDYIP